MNALAIEVDGKLSQLKTLESAQRETRAMAVLQEAWEVLADCPNWRQAYIIQRDVEAMRGAAKVYRLSIEIQIKAADVSIRAIYELGRALRDAYGSFPGQVKDIAYKTDISSSVVGVALRSTLYTWTSIAKASASIKAKNNIPTLSLVLSMCKANRLDFRDFVEASTNQKALQSAAYRITDFSSNTKTLRDLISKMRSASSKASGEISIVARAEANGFLNRQEIRDDIAFMIWTHRKMAEDLKKIRFAARAAMKPFRNIT